MTTTTGQRLRQDAKAWAADRLEDHDHVFHSGFCNIGQVTISSKDGTWSGFYAPADTF